MARQLCCRGMCKNLLRSDSQQWNYSKTKFPSNLNCGQKIVSETGPCTRCPLHSPLLPNHLCCDCFHPIQWVIPTQEFFYVFHLTSYKYHEKWELIWCIMKMESILPGPSWVSSQCFMLTDPMHITNWNKINYHIDGLVQDCSISSAFAMEILQSCTKPSISYMMHIYKHNT